MDWRPRSVPIGKTQEKAGPPGKEGRKDLEAHGPHLLPRRTPRSHDCPLTTLPVVTTPPGRHRAAGTERLRGPSAAGSDRAAPVARPPPRSRRRPGGRPAPARGAGTHLQTPNLTTGGRVLLQPVPTSPSSQFGDTQSHTLTISQLLGSPGIAPPATAGGSGHGGAGADADTPGPLTTLTAQETRDPGASTRLAGCCPAHLPFCASDWTVRKDPPPSFPSDN